MTPTPQLRFVERVKITHIDNAGNATGTAIRILQQWWEVKTYIHTNGELDGEIVKGEWRDVPLEKE